MSIKIKNLKVGDHIQFDRPKPEEGRGTGKILRQLGTHVEVVFDNGRSAVIGPVEFKSWNVTLIEYGPACQMGDRVRFQFMDEEREGTICGFYPNGNALIRVDGMEAGIEMQTHELELIDDESSNDGEGAIVLPEILEDKPLSMDEFGRLLQLEKTIAAGLGTFVEVGQALKEIRDSRLYRDSYLTFEDYCREKFDIGRNYANKQIAASDFVQDLGTKVHIIPATETQVRPLLSLPPEKRVEAWQEVIKTNEKPTAKAVEEVVRQFKAPSSSGGGSRQEQEPSPPPQREVPQAIKDSAELLFGKEGEIVWLEGLEHAVRLAATGGERIVLTDKLSTALFSTFMNDYLCIAGAYGLAIFYVGGNEIDFYEAFNGLGGIWSRMVEA